MDCPVCHTGAALGTEGVLAAQPSSCPHTARAYSQPAPGGSLAAPWVALGKPTLTVLSPTVHIELLGGRELL